ncbi:MAG: adenylyltransferase/cytidyltransferase family protein [Patescibacteria group bacterium]|jgi:cytidyltransferase-like protein
MKTVLTFGTFDLFHEGHKKYLEQARAYGDKLVVVVARDETVFVMKGHYPDEREEQRIKRVLASGLADEVVLGSNHEYFQILDLYPPNVVVLGYDQSNELTEQLEDELQKRGIEAEILRAEPYKPEQFHSSLLRKKPREKS